VKALAICLGIAAMGASSPRPQLVDISYDEKAPQKRRAVKFQVMDVLLIDVVDGPRAVVQFTELGSRHGAYRWRCRRAGSAVVLTGQGTVAEKYEEIPDSPKRGHMLPLPGHDPIVRADVIRAAWSWADERSAYLYYYPRLANVKVLPAGSFESGP
jgi:hypothetical protein